MWYQDTELLGLGVQPERKEAEWVKSSWRWVSKAWVPGKDGFGAWPRNLFVDMILTINPSGLNSGANGLSEVTEITFQIMQQKCDKKIYLLPFPPPLPKILTLLLPLPHVSISVSSFQSLRPSVNQQYMTLSSRKTFTFNCHQAFIVS